jgi:hypothetical protein
VNIRPLNDKERRIFNYDPGALRPGLIIIHAIVALVGTLLGNWVFDFSLIVGLVFNLILFLILILLSTLEYNKDFFPFFDNL